MTQDPLFFEDFRGSVEHLVKMLGGPKVVGGLLRPGWPVKKASDWVLDCLSANRQTKFDFEDLSALLSEGRKRGVHCAIFQLCDETGYDKPDLKTPKSERQVLAEKRVRLAEEWQRLADEEAALERAETAAQIRGVR